MQVFSTRKPNTIRFRAMMESGLLVDEEADIVQTQVIAHKSRASIRNRNTVPLYHQTEEGRPPVWKENLLVETGLSLPPGMDSRYCLEDSQNLHAGIRSGAVEIDGDNPLKSHGLAIVVNITAVIVFVACAWLSGLNTHPDPPVAEAATKEAVEEQAESREETDERVSYGFVETLEGEESQEAGEEAGKAGSKEAGDTGSGREGDPGVSAEEPLDQGAVDDNASAFP